MTDAQSNTADQPNTGNSLNIGSESADDSVVNPLIGLAEPPS